MARHLPAKLLNYREAVQLMRQAPEPWGMAGSRLIGQVEMLNEQLRNMYVVLYYSREPLDEDGYPDMQNVVYGTLDEAVEDATQQLQNEGRVRGAGARLALVEGLNGRHYLMNDNQVPMAKIIPVHVR